MTAEHTAMSPTRTPGSILGTRVTRTEDPGLLTGTAIYLDDLHIEGSLHAVFVRSDVAHGTIDSIETDEAASMPGVVAVLTFADLGVPAHHGFAPFHDDFKRPPLADHRRQQAAEILAAPSWADARIVFPTRVGTVTDPTKARRRLAKICTEAGVTVVRPNELRHSCASLLSDAGVPLELIADLLGHASTDMLDRTYRHRLRPSIDVAARATWAD